MLLNKNKLKILEEFAGDYTKRIYGRATSKKLKINQKTISNILNELEKENILKFKVEGKNKYYYLNEFYSQIKDIIHLIETQRKIEFLEKYKKLREVFLKLEQKSEGILIIFGSYADFSSTEKSDLDVFVIGKIKNIESLEDSYNLKINVIKSNKTKFDKEEHLVKEIIKKHVILKGVEDFVNLIW